MTQQLTHAALSTIALLLARGCETEHIDTAFDWLATRSVPRTPTTAIAQVDEAIGIARSLDATTS